MGIRDDICAPSAGRFKFEEDASARYSAAIAKAQKIKLESLSLAQLIEIMDVWGFKFQHGHKDPHSQKMDEAKKIENLIARSK